MIKEMSGKRWEEWYYHSQTQEFLVMLKDSVTGDMLDWTSGNFANPDNPASSAVLDAMARGNVMNTRRLIDAIEGIIIKEEGVEEDGSGSQDE